MKSTIATTKKMILDELNKAYENNPSKEIEKKLILFVENELGVQKQGSSRRKRAGYATLVSVFVWVIVYYFSQDALLAIAFALLAGFLTPIWIPERMCISADKALSNYFKLKSIRDNQKENEAEQRLINEYLTPIKNPQGEDK